MPTPAPHPVASRRLFRLCIAVATVTAPALAAPAQQDPRWDPATGRSLASYPPSPLFDHQHIKLELDVPDIETAAFTGTATLTTVAIGAGQTRLVLDARSPLTFSAVTVNGAAAAFSTVTGDDGLGKVVIEPAEPFKPGAVATVVMQYSALKPYKDGSGLNWFKTRRGEDDVHAKQGAIVYSQGQSNFNSLWFPCYDYPNDKLTSEVIVTVESAYQTISNGRLVGKTEVLPAKTGTGFGRTRWHWLQDKPHASYLVMLAIGKFDLVDVGGEGTARPGLAMPVYGPVGSAADLGVIFKNTPAMVAHFEQLFDEPYPWDKYAQVIVRHFRWGGMENTSATVLAEYAGSGGPNSQDDLIAHELGHQWWGDLITCKSWEHLWLNEGWATMCEWLWVEHRDGPEAYLAAVRQARNALAITAVTPAPEGVAMVSPLYAEPDDTFTKAEDPYKRGGFFLHMLRQRLGDELFFKGSRLFLDRFKFQSVETDDFRKVMEEVSGHSLQRFFDQWARRPAMPVLKVDHAMEGSSLVVKVEQLQTINAENPAYALRLPIYCEFAPPNGGSSPAGQWVYVDIDTRTVEQRFSLAQEPSRVRIDPNASLLARFERLRPANSAPAEP